MIAEYFALMYLGAASKLNRRLTSSSVWLCKVVIVLNNDNCPEPGGTASRVLKSPLTGKAQVCFSPFHSHGTWKTPQATPVLLKPVREEVTAKITPE